MPPFEKNLRRGQHVWSRSVTQHEVPLGMHGIVLSSNEGSMLQAKYWIRFDNGRQLLTCPTEVFNATELRLARKRHL